MATTRPFVNLVAAACMLGVVSVSTPASAAAKTTKKPVAGPKRTATTKARGPKTPARVPKPTVTRTIEANSDKCKAVVVRYRVSNALLLTAASSAVASRSKLLAANEIAKAKCGVNVAKIDDVQLEVALPKVSNSAIAGLTTPGVLSAAVMNREITIDPAVGLLSSDSSRGTYLSYDATRAYEVGAAVAADLPVASASFNGLIDVRLTPAAAAQIDALRTGDANPRLVFSVDGRVVTVPALSQVKTGSALPLTLRMSTPDAQILAAVLASQYPAGTDVISVIGA